jgi:hypothetical protein
MNHDQVCLFAGESPRHRGTHRDGANLRYRGKANDLDSAVLFPTWSPSFIGNEHSVLDTRARR